MSPSTSANSSTFTLPIPSCAAAIEPLASGNIAQCTRPPTPRRGPPNAGVCDIAVCVPDRHFGDATGASLCNCELPET
jgi:hypothetical protein